MPAVRPSVLRLIPLVLGAGCVPTQSPDAQDSQRPAPHMAGTTADSGTTSEPMGSTALARRLSTSARAFQSRDGDFVAQHLSFEATLGADGLLLQRRQGDTESAVQLAVASWGRDLALIYNEFH